MCVCVRSWFCFEVLCVVSSLATVTMWEREPVAILLTSSECHVTDTVLILFLPVPRVCLACVIVTFKIIMTKDNVHF